jgi:hypothetical protein
MEVGQIGPGIQLVVLLVVEVYNCIQEVVHIPHQMKLGRRVLESLTMRKCAMKTIVYVSSCNLISN